MKKIRLILISCIVMLLGTGCGESAYKQGVEALKNKEYDLAVEYFQRSIEKEKHLADSYRGLGISYWETGKYEEASKALKRAIEMGTKKNGTLYNLMGCAYLRSEQYEKAEEMFALALEDSTCSSELVKEIERNRIVVCEKLGKLDEAKEYLSEYVEKYPEESEALKEQEFLETR